jgi:AdoMet-dependent heme synthase
MVVNLCTNGILLKTHAEALCESGAGLVTVSVDGATAKTHETLRDAPGTFCRIEEGIQCIMARPSSTRPLIRVRMTVSRRNVQEVGAFYRKWKNRVDDVLLQPVHHCGDAYYTGLDAAGLFLDSKILAAQLAGTPMENDVYMSRFVESLRTGSGFPIHRCYAGILMVRIDPWGNVYPCLEQHVRIGSLREADFSTLWNGHVFQKERLRLASERTCGCWYNNTAMIGYYGNLLFQTTAAGVRQAIRQGQSKRFTALDA